MSWHDANMQKPYYVGEQHALTYSLHLKSSLICMFMQPEELLWPSGQNSKKSPHH